MEISFKEPWFPCILVLKKQHVTQMVATLNLLMYLLRSPEPYKPVPRSPLTSDWPCTRRSVFMVYPTPGAFSPPTEPSRLFKTSMRSFELSTGKGKGARAKRTVTRRSHLSGPLGPKSQRKNRFPSPQKIGSSAAHWIGQTQTTSCFFPLNCSTRKV